jgi:DNA-binding transcriptional LysR family regulator
LQEFSELYPDIRVELILNDDQVDIGMRAADAAIWTREPEQADLIRRSLFESRVRAFASAQYIRKHGTPRTLADLDQHRIIAYSGVPAQHLDAMSWIETAGRDGNGSRPAALRVNSVVAIKYAIQAGIGIGMIPDYMSDAQSELVPVLSEIEQPSLNLVFAYPEELKSSKKVQLLRDFLVSKISKAR